MTKVIKISLKNKPNLSSLFDSHVKRMVDEEYNYSNNDYAEGSIIAYLTEKLDELYGEGQWDENDLYEYGKLLGLNRFDLYCCMNNNGVEWDYPSENDYWDDNFSVRKKKKHKHKKSKKKPLYSFYDDNSFDDVVLQDTEDYYPSSTEYKEIWYYPDYHDDIDKLEFNSLKDFSDYCADEGIYVPPFMADLLKYQSVSHCCLSGTSKENGRLELTVDDTYSNMFYTACTMSEAEEMGI